MHCISSDDVTISHGKQPPQKVTVINDDCQPGKYIVSMTLCLWQRMIFGILMTLEEDQDV